jgi:hypothetical protein
MKSKRARRPVGRMTRGRRDAIAGTGHPASLKDIRAGEGHTSVSSSTDEAPYRTCRDFRPDAGEAVAQNLARRAGDRGKNS